VNAAAAPVVFLFTDIEGSTRLWEQQPERMRAALAAHDALARDAVAAHGGRLVKTTGDGLHAVFADALHGLAAVLALQRAIAEPAATAGLPLAVRCGLHASDGGDQARDNDYYGRAVNRAARIMAVAHGGQVLLSAAVAQAVAGRLPAGVALRELGEVRLRDLQQPERLFQLLAPPLRSDFPALRALAETPHNLVATANRFIGRAQELAALRALLPQHRLLTLLGPGGIGKTRLSLQLARALLDDPAFADGVWWVELSPLSDAAQVPQALAAVLGVKEAPGQSLSDALADCVRERRLLIVLDNCEHLRSAVAALAKRLLAAGPGVQLLASSREALHIAGEQVVAVPALSAPAPGTALGLSALLAHDAVRLFVDRAQAVAPGWRLAEGADLAGQPDAAGAAPATAAAAAAAARADAAAVAEICHRLDGIPLAVELAAARVRALPLPALAARLRDSFKLLATTDTTVPPRQRTLRLLIDWSHDLLGPAEQALLRRLSVFAGGWTLDDAELVCADALLPADEVVEHLAALVDKSLVQPVLEGGRHGGRYQLLDTIRQYAAQRLQQAEGDDGQRAAQRRHVANRLALAEAARAQIPGPQQAGWLARLDAERDNLVAALGQAARDPQGAEDGLRLSIALRPYWLNRGLLTLGVGTAKAALGHAGALADALAPLRARALFETGHLCNFAGQSADARDCLEACLQQLRGLNNESKAAAVLQPLGTAYAALGDQARAGHCFEQALAAARAVDVPHQLTSALVALALWHSMHGRLDAAEPQFSEALAIARVQGDDEVVVVSLLNLAMVAVGRGRHWQALPLVAEALPLACQSGARVAMLGVLDLGCVLAAVAHDWPQAGQWRAAAQALAAQTGLHRDPADAAFIAPWLVLIDAQTAAAGLADPAGAHRGDALVFAADEGPLRALADWLQQRVNLATG
jgi:predicted ATPase/class 3 adenylate cyclase